MITTENVKTRIGEMLTKQTASNRYDEEGEIYLGTLNLITQLYGPVCPQLDAIKATRENIWSSKFIESEKVDVLLLQWRGMLRTILDDVEKGRIGSLRLEYQGEVFADMLNLSKQALSDGAKDVAAVLACASLEDILKRFAETNGLSIEGKDLDSIINALKGKGLLSATQSSLVKGMVPTRNKALHADWEKVDRESVPAIIAFVEEFLIRQFK